MRLSSKVQELGASSNHDRARGNVAENAAPEHPSPPQKPKKTSEAHEDYDSRLSEILGTPRITGAAIALVCDDYLECIRSHGDSAPPTGSRWHPGVGLTRASLATGKVQLCSDTENDSRADPQACAHLGVRSVLVVPIKRDSAVVGVLEVLSSEPDAFEWRSIRHIRRIAKELSEGVPKSSGNSQQEPADRSLLWVPGDFDLHKVLHAAWLIQRNGGLALREHDAVLKADSDHAQDKASKSAQVPAGNVVEGAPQVDTPIDVPSFGTLDAEFAKEDWRPRVVAAAIALAIPLACFFLFRAQPRALNKFFGSPPHASRLSSPVSVQPPQSGENDKAQPESHNRFLVQRSAPTQRTTHQLAPQTYADAMAQFEQAARNGDPDASWNLGVGYLKGIGVPKDEARAAEWFKRAANLGDTRAQSTLTDLYFRGIGVQRDYVRAYTWASIAARQQGSGEDRLETLRQRMTRAEIDDANRRVTTWFAQRTPKR